METKFKIGDKVRIIHYEIPENSNHYGEDNSYFQKYVGIETEIISFIGLNYDGIQCYETSLKLDYEDLENGIGSSRYSNVFVSENSIELI